MIKIPILMYHSISDDNFFLSVSKNKFIKQLSFLKKMGFETINFDNIKDANKLEIGILFYVLLLILFPKQYLKS